MSDWQNVDGFAAIRRRRRLEIIFPYHLDSAAVRQMLRKLTLRASPNWFWKSMTLRILRLGSISSEISR